MFSVWDEMLYIFSNRKFFKTQMQPSKFLVFLFSECVVQNYVKKLIITVK